jgi:adenylate cyclase class 2
MKAHKEVEIKLKVASRAEAQKRLRAAGAQRIRAVIERNTLFDTPNARLRKRGQLLRLREETPKGHRRRRCLLTFKGPSLAGGRYKVRAEVEYEVGKPSEVAKNLRSLGLRPVFRYEKVRTTYSLRQVSGLRVELDEVPFGIYLELEGPRGKIDRAARILGFRREDYIAQSYLALHAGHCRRLGRPVGDMLFSRKKIR